MKRRIAFFDFDGTITSKDTLLEFIKYYHGSVKFYAGFTLTSPFIAAWKAGLISNQAAKEQALRFFFRNESVATFKETCEAFAANELPSLIRPKALQEIEKLKAAGTEVVIVSASADDWLAPWCHKYDLNLLGTKLEVANERLTGKILGANCHGHEKVNRIRLAYDLNAYDEVYGYGDTKGDKPMLELATFSFYKPFR